MKIDLLDLLATRSIAHPTRVQSVTMTDGLLCLTIGGWAWWRETGQEHEGLIRLTFSGLSSGTIDLRDWLSGDDFDEVLDDFEVCRTSEVEWAQPTSSQIYGCAPLPQPLVLYDRVEEYLQDQFALRRPADFLNGAGRLSRFLDHASSNFYLLATGPRAICDLILDELERQGVPHQVMDAKGRPQAPIFVRFGDHAFFCEHATAEFD
ncbi:hypothetical protein D3C80_1431110 [compost metagenome]